METMKNLKSTLREKEMYESRLERIVASCPHAKRGESKLRVVGDRTVQCRYCDTKFSLEIVSRADMEKAKNTLHTIFNQIKVYSKKNEESDQIIEHMASSLYFLNKYFKIYDRLMAMYADNDRKREDQDYRYAKHGSRHLLYNR